MNTPLHASDEFLAELFDLLEKMEHDSKGDEFDTQTEIEVQNV